MAELGRMAGRRRMRTDGCTPADAHRRIQKTGRFAHCATATWENKPSEAKSAGFLYDFSMCNGGSAHRGRCVD